MKTLPVPLITAQKTPGGKPVAELVVSQFGHPQACPVVGWQWFAWEQLYSTDSITATCHGVAIPADGSLNRVRFSTGTPCYVMHQRVASPGPASDFTGWSQKDQAYSTTALAIAALGNEVCIYFIGDGSGYVYEKKSTDNGVTLGAAAKVNGTSGILGKRCLSACYKDASKLCLVYVDTSDNQLKVGIRSGSTWNFYAFGTYISVYWTAVYYDGDYNIIALVNRNEVFSLARIVFGDGYRQGQYTFSNVDYLNTSSASVYAWQVINNYMGSLPPYSDFETARKEFMSRFKRVYTKAQIEYLRNFQNPYAGAGLSGGPGSAPSKNGIRPLWPRGWDSNSAISIGRATDNIDLDFPFICRPPGHPPIMTFIRSGERWTFRLKPGTDFYDNYWGLADSQKLSTPCGLAVASDGSYVWGTRANEVWRMPVPGLLQLPPPAGTGEGDNITIMQADIAGFQENIFSHAAGNLLVEIDNARGDYDGLPNDYIRRGSQVKLKYGYIAHGVPQYNPGNIYFIEDWSYERSPNRASVVLHCIDAWGLLENFTIPAPAELNFIAEEYSVYELIEILLQCIGGTLTYVSRSDAMVSLYPRLLINAGETAAGVLRRLLDLVPDVLRFDGLTCYVINPLATDQPVYRYHFPHQEEKT
jgi:hypothetical protein